MNKEPQPLTFTPQPDSVKDTVERFERERFQLKYLRREKLLTETDEAIHALLEKAYK